MIVTLLLAVATAAPAETVLVEEGRPRCSVVTPDETSDTVRRAAEELVAYVERISGAKLPMVREAEFDADAFDSALEHARKALGYCKVPKAAEYVESWQTAGRLLREMGVPAMGFGDPETKGGRTCWNSDETGPGDNANGWATFVIRTPDPTRPVVVEIDAWGTSALRSIVVNTGPGAWTPVRPQSRLSGKEQWGTLVYRIPPSAMDPERKSQKIGFGGADSQVWIAEIRVREP